MEILTIAIIAIIAVGAIGFISLQYSIGLIQRNLYLSQQIDEIDKSYYESKEALKAELEALKGKYFKLHIDHEKMVQEEYNRKYQQAIVHEKLVGKTQ